MGRIKSIIARGVLCVAVMAGSTGLALACGNMLIYPLLFRAYSEAGRAYDAERLARRAGELSATVWSAGLGLTYHQWSLLRARRALDGLSARLHRSTATGRSDVTVSIMLADEVYMAQLRSGSREVVLKPFHMGHPKSNISLYTTANALRALVDGRMGWEEAVRRDLVVMADPAHQQHRVGSLLSTAFSDSSPVD